ncbi:MAG: CHAT domain-containing protein [Cyclobacteriaceae bacterium]|nr:CHAT domain-containing protein [Cyclobacteriaceae bacterium]
MKATGLIVACWIFASANGLAQSDLLQASFDSEEVAASLYYAAKINQPDERNLLIAEAALLGDQFMLMDSALNLINAHRLTPCQQLRYNIFLALVFQHKKFLSEANQKLELAESLIKKCSSSEASAMLNYWKGYYFLQQNKPDDSKHTLKTAIAYYSTDTTRYKVKIAHSLFWLGTTYLRNNELDSALLCLHQSEKKYKDTPFDKSLMLVKIYNNLGATYHALWDYRLAEKYYLTALALNKQKQNNPNELALAYNNLGVFYDSYENFIRSIQYYEEAVLWTDISALDPPRKALIYQNYAASLTNHYRQEEALQQFLKALEIITPYKTYYGNVYARIINNIVAMQISQTLLEDAGKWLNQLEEFYRDSTDEAEEQKLWYYFNRANLANQEGQVQVSLQLLTALEKKLKPDSDLYKKVRQNKAANLKAVGLLDSSRTYYRQLISDYERIYPVTHPQLVQLYNDIGTTFKQADSAIYYFNLSRKNNLLNTDVVNNESFYASKMEWITSNFNLLKLELEAYEAGTRSQQQLFQADGLIQSSLTVIQSNITELQADADKINFNRAVRDFYDLATDYYYLVYKLTGQTDFVERAFQDANLNKYQILQRAIRLDRVKSFARVTEKVLREENQLSKTIAQLEFQYSQELAKQSEPDRALLQEYRDQMHILRTRFNFLLDSIQNHLPDYHALKFSKEPVSLAVLEAAYLSKNQKTAWVEYCIGNKNSYAILLADKKRYFISLGSSYEIKRQVRAMKNSIAVKESSAFFSSSQALYQLIFKKVDSCLQASNKKINKIVVIPDDIINLINFELLGYAGKYAWVYNVFKYQFNYGYSSTLLWRSYTDAPAKNMNMLAMAPEFKMVNNSNNLRNADVQQIETHNFPPLLRNQEEVKQAVGIMNKKNSESKVYIGSEADESSFKKEDLSKFSIIHLATHGFTGNNQIEPGIAFSRKANSADDGILYMNEVFALRSNAYLICLSACETGIGTYANGEGIIGLTRAFLYTGTKNMVVSLWRVDDEATEKFMISFYASLSKKQSISQSLYQAKVQMLKNSMPGLTFDWAAFIQVGLN